MWSRYTQKNGLQVFAKAGVPRGKLGVMPEAVDTAFFDPALAAGERQQVTSPLAAGEVCCL